MKTKEKAEELCDKMYKVGYANHASVKKYALIAVDETLRVLLFASTPPSKLHEEITFWSQVKEEINKP